MGTDPKNVRGTEHPDVKPLSVEEIQRALELSGYPLEVELCRELASVGLTSALGTRLQVETDPAAFKEIDIIATRAGFAAEDIQVDLRLFVQVKRLPDNKVFVGVLGEPPGEPQNLAERFQITGNPSVPEVAQECSRLFYDHKDGLSRALEPMLALPVCVHWAVVFRKQQTPWAAGESGVAEDLSTLVRARQQSHASFSAYCALNVAFPVLSLSQLALVIDAPVFTYAADTKRLQPVDYLSVYQAFDTGDGPRSAMIDVVARSAVLKYARLCIDSIKRLEGAAEHHASTLKSAIKTPRKPRTYSELRTLRTKFSRPDDDSVP